MTKTERKARDQRMIQVREAVTDERIRVNGAIKATITVIIPTSFGPYQLDAVTAEYDYITHPAGQAKNWMNQRTFAGCNDPTWAGIMRDAGLKRHPLFAEYS